MSRLLKQDWGDAAQPWSEDDHQMAVVQWLRRAGYCVAADQNAGRRSARDGARRKLLGMQAGEPDLRVYLPGARLLLIEMKAARGSLSREQRELHARLAGLGHDVLLVREAAPAAAVQRVAQRLDELHAAGVERPPPRPAAHTATRARLAA